MACLPCSTKGIGGEYRWRSVASFEGFLRVSGIFIDRIVNLNLELMGVDEICPFVANDGDTGASMIELTLRRWLS